jgi:hypothetical protein
VKVFYCNFLNEFKFPNVNFKKLYQTLSLATITFLLNTKKVPYYVDF